MLPRRLLRNIAFRVPRSTSGRGHVFILGAPRSGTTLLKSLLAAHPVIGGSDYESTGIFGFRDIFKYALGELSPSHVQELLGRSNDIIQFYDLLTHALLELKQKQVFVDKLQMRSYRIRYVSRCFPQAKFVAIVRDGRDCFCSAQLHPNIPQSRSVDTFARYWRKCVTLPRQILPSNRLFILRYEDLTLDPERILRDVMTYLKVDYHPNQVSVKQYAATTSIKKRKVHENLARPITATSHARWRVELSPSDINRFARIAGNELLHYGYEAV